MISGVLRSITAGIFFTSYFDLVDRFDFYRENLDRAIISPVADINEFNLKGMQPLHYAVEAGNFGATFNLIENFGADVNEHTRTVAVQEPSEAPRPQVTPLIIAIQKNNLEIFHYLLSKKELNVDLGTEQFKTPLHFAAEVGNLEMVEALIAHKAKISYLKGTRKTAFHLALASCNVDVAAWLAERNLGVGPVCQDRTNQLESIFHYLARQKLPTDIWIKMLKVCESTTTAVEKKPVIRFCDRRSMSGLTSLQVAIEEENGAAIAGLIISGADLSPVTFGRTTFRTPLIKETFDFFQGAKITTEFRNQDNEMIWHFCARLDAVHLIQAVVFEFPTKQNLRSCNSKGLTALELAFEMHNFNVALELIKLHENYIDVDVLGRLAIMATWNCWSDLTEALIREFPQDFAFIMSSASPITLLHIVATAPVRELTANSNPKTLVLLLVKHYPHAINTLDKLGRTPLHLALECDFTEFFEWLGEAKTANPELDFDVKDEAGNSFAALLRERGENEILGWLKL